MARMGPASKKVYLSSFKYFLINFSSSRNYHCEHSNLSKGNINIQKNYHSLIIKAGSEEAKMSTERVITVGHESNEVLLNATQRVLEKVGADPLHAQPIQTDTSQTVNY